MRPPQYYLSLWEGAQDPSSLGRAGGELSNRNLNEVRKSKYRWNQDLILRETQHLKEASYLVEPQKGRQTMVRRSASADEPHGSSQTLPEGCRRKIEMTSRKAQDSLNRPWALNTPGLEQRGCRCVYFYLRFWLYMRQWQWISVHNSGQVVTPSRSAWSQDICTPDACLPYT